MLVLAGSLSSHLQLSRVAACCRQRILEHNPQHMVRRWPDFATALEDSDFQHVLKQNQRRFPPEKAERLLDDLGIDMANERATYYSDEEYAAELLGDSQ